MEKKENFRFSVTVSKEGYECKQDAIASLSAPGAKAINRAKMAWHECEIDVSEFLKLAMSGYCFCNLFKYDPNKQYWYQDKNGRWMKQYPIYKRGVNKGYMKTQFKADEYFRGAQTVFVDIDKTKYENVKDYLEALSVPPTCVYMSFSDGLEKGKDHITSRRFRMVYIFDEIMDEKAFEHISKAITSFIVKDTCEKMEDDCGTRKSQYMNGVYGNNESYRSDIIYSISDFEEGGKFYCRLEEIVKHEKVEDTTTISPQLIWDMENLDYKTFMHYNSRKYKYFYRTEKDEWIDDLYQIADDDFLQLYYNREKVPDGQQRRRKLFYVACLRRLMRPEVNGDELLFNLYVDRERFYDNSDGVITISHLKNKVKRVMQMSVEELEYVCAPSISYWRKNHPNMIFRHGAKVKYSWGTLRQIEKNIRYEEIDEQYDPSMSLRENVEAGLDVPMSTLYRYADARGYDTDPNRPPSIRKQRDMKREEKKNNISKFIDLFDPNRTSQENMRIMAENGLTLSYRTYKNWKEKHIPKAIPQDPITFQSLDSFCNINHFKDDVANVKEEDNVKDNNSWNNSWWHYDTGFNYQPLSGDHPL